jgi:hypothetical protein
MKCAKEVVEKWELATNVRYTKELTEMVEVITEFLYTKASEGQNSIPKIEVTEYRIEDRAGVFEYVLKIDNKYPTYSANQNDFFTVMRTLGYNVKRTSVLTYVISPNPSC